MKVEELKIKYPNESEHGVHVTKEEMEQHIPLMAALKMFELGKNLFWESCGISWHVRG